MQAIQDAEITHADGAGVDACIASAETCNQVDDDCDGAVDEDDVCCKPATETCNNKDDDCDGVIDNGGAKN